MRPFRLALLSYSLLVVLAGCGTSADPPAPASAPAPPGGLAVIDLDAVARRLGRDTWLDDETRKKEKQLNERLAAMQQSFTEQMEHERSEAGELLTREQRQELQAMQSRLAQELQRARQQGQAELIAFRQELVDQFRADVRPTARQVAAERGLSVVIPKDAHLVLSVEPDAEITDAVADRLAARAPDASANGDSPMEDAPSPPRLSEATGPNERR